MTPPTTCTICDDLFRNGGMLEGCVAKMAFETYHETGHFPSCPHFGLTITLCGLMTELEKAAGDLRGHEYVGPSIFPGKPYGEIIADTERRITNARSAIQCLVAEIRAASPPSLDAPAEITLTQKQAWAIFGLGIRSERGSYPSAYSGADYAEALKVLRLIAGVIQAEGKPMHLCGARGFGYELNDKCPACDAAEARRRESPDAV